MRIVGQFNNIDIRVTGLHMSETYGGWLLGPSQSRYEEVNWEMMNVGIPQRVEKMWGKNKIVHVMDLDYKKRLPAVEVIASLDCAIGTKKGDYSSLVLAWFQEPDMDPFAQLIRNLKEINWKEKAEGWWIQNL